MRNLVLRGIAACALLLPLTAHGDPPKVVAAAPATVPAALKSSAAITKSSVTALTADEKTAVQSALAAAGRQFEKDSDKKKLLAAGSGLSSTGQRYYAARVHQYLAAKARPKLTAQSAPTIVSKPRYVVTTVSVNTYIQNDCAVEIWLDLGFKNTGTGAPAAAPLMTVVPEGVLGGPTTTLPLLGIGGTGSARVGPLKTSLSHAPDGHCPLGGNPGPHKMATYLFEWVDGPAYELNIDSGVPRFYEIDLPPHDDDFPGTVGGGGIAM